MYKTTFERIHEVIITFAIILGFGEVILSVLSIRIPFLEDIVFSRINTLIMVYGFTLFVVYSVIRVMIKIPKTLKENISKFSILPSKEIRIFLEAVKSCKYELDECYSDTGNEFEALMVYNLTKNKLISFIKKSRSFYTKTLRNCK